MYLQLPGEARMTFPELVKSNQINIDSDFLKMKLLEKEAYELKH